VQATDQAASRGVASDVHIVNGFPIDDGFLSSLADRYERIVTLEDGVIGTKGAGLRGFAAFVAGRLADCDVSLDHLGISDPQIAPSDTFDVVWAHYGMTAEAIARRL
jgi:deoxyxylulose-5-phosphate synthase